MTIRWMSRQSRPMPIFATKKRSTGANEQLEREVAACCSLSIPGPVRELEALTELSSSQLPRLATGRVAVTNGYSHRMFC